MRNIITDSDVPMLVFENLSNQTVIIDKNRLIGRGKRPEQIARFMIEGENPDSLFHVSTNLTKVSLKPKESAKGCQSRLETIDPKADEKTFDFSMLDVGENLTTNQKDKLEKLIMKYKSRFALGLQDLEDTNLPPVDFDTGDSKPYFSPSRRFSPKEHDAIDREVAELVKYGIVKPSKSPWRSPICLIRKSDGSIRFCLDMREVNKRMKGDSYPVPRVDEALEQLKGCSIFSTMDCLSGFMQLNLTKRGAEVTAFSTRQGHWQFEKLPFGAKCSPSLFSRTIGAVFEKLRFKSVLTYVDDMLVKSKNFDEHLIHLEEVFKNIRT